jgi:hypothetical protein
MNKRQISRVLKGLSVAGLVAGLGVISGCKCSSCGACQKTESKDAESVSCGKTMSCEKEK